MDVVADTCFYIDVERGKPNVLNWLQNNGNVRLILTPITYAELAVGQPDPLLLNRLVGPGPRLELDYDAATEFGKAARVLRGKGQMIGVNDLWIASIALANGLAVLTRNTNEFCRVPGLKVLSY